MTPKVLLSDKKINIILNRLCYQLIERHGDFSKCVLVGLQPRGTFLLTASPIVISVMEYSNLRVGN